MLVSKKECDSYSTGRLRHYHIQNADVAAGLVKHHIVVAYQRHKHEVKHGRKGKPASDCINYMVCEYDWTVISLHCVEWWRQNSVPRVSLQYKYGISAFRMEAAVEPPQTSYTFRRVRSPSPLTCLSWPAAVLSGAWAASAAPKVLYY